MKIETTARLESDTYQTPIHVEAALRFLSALPPAATGSEVHAIWGDRGTQRDPDPFVRGLLVKWYAE